MVRVRTSLSPAGDGRGHNTGLLFGMTFLTVLGYRRFKKRGLTEEPIPLPTA